MTDRTLAGFDVLTFTHDARTHDLYRETLRRTLGDSFEYIEIDSSPGNPFGIRSRAHSVLTVDLVDQPGHPTRAALDRGIAFLEEPLCG